MHGTRVSRCVAGSGASSLCRHATRVAGSLSASLRCRRRPRWSCQARGISRGRHDEGYLYVSGGVDQFDRAVFGVMVGTCGTTRAGAGKEHVASGTALRQRLARDYGLEYVNAARKSVPHRVRTDRGQGGSGPSCRVRGRRAERPDVDRRAGHGVVAAHPRNDRRSAVASKRQEHLPRHDATTQTGPSESPLTALTR